MQYVQATIRWKDTGANEDVIIKLSCGYTPKEDDLIFFFCNGIHEVNALMDEDNGQDFVVLDYAPCDLIL
jgi:hypothetical protein